MRVMLVTPGEAMGCSMVFARRDARSLAAQGIHVREFFLRSRTSPVRLAREFLRFRREAARFRPHVIHAQFGSATAMFAALAAGATPLVITYRGSDLNPSPGERLRSAFARILSQAAALRAARIVCVSTRLRDRLWWRRSRATIAPSGVDIAAFRPFPREPARERLGWPLVDRVVLFNAGLSPRVKRVDLAGAAIAAARREIANLRFEVLDGSTAPDRMPELMNASDCLLVTSDQEGSPTVVQEALAVNLPIVSVDVGDVSERVAGVRHTRVVERDAEALGRAIVEMVRVPLRSDGVSKVNEFCSGKLAAQLIGIYREVAAKRAAAKG